MRNNLWCTAQTEVTFKPRRFLLINTANLRNQLEPVVNPVFRNLFQNSWSQSIETTGVSLQLFFFKSPNNSKCDHTFTHIKAWAIQCILMTLKLCPDSNAASFERLHSEIECAAKAVPIQSWNASFNSWRIQQIDPSWPRLSQDSSCARKF